MSLRVPPVCVLALVLVLPCEATAGTQVHVRGPGLDGHAEAIRFQLPWPDSGPPIVWRKQVGEGYSGILAVVCMQWARRSPTWRRAAAARLALVAFVCLVVGYGWVCRRLFLVSGWGYLVGLLPSWPLIRSSVDHGAACRMRRAVAADVAAFSLYFWIGALYVCWRTGG